MTTFLKALWSVTEGQFQRVKVQLRKKNRGKTKVQNNISKNAVETKVTMRRGRDGLRGWGAVADGSKE